MSDTQTISCVPLSEASRKASGSAQWCLEKAKDGKARVFHQNNLEVFICGELAFAQIAEDIRNAQRSIDIICWGFDPAMELTRKMATDWPRGETWGRLLEDAAKRGVEVRLLAWHDAVGSPMVNNMPGYGRDAPYELKAAASRGMAAAVLPAGSLREQPRPTDNRDQREVFNANWYRRVVAGQMAGVSLRTRGGVHQDVVASLKGESGSWSLGAIERLGMEYLATHHQKTIVIDYEGAKPCGYVMGLNSVTDYWDTTKHAFHEPQRGESWEGANDEEPGLKPFQDYACRVEGEVLVAVCKNFTDAWNKAEARGKGAGRNLSRSCDFEAPPKNLTQNLATPRHRALIARTLPAGEGSEKSIQRLYSQAGSFARHYVYVENQYFQNAAWVSHLKAQRDEYVKGCKAARMDPAEVPKLHVMAVIPTPERAQMVPRTHDTVTELGHGASMPNQSKALDAEIARFDATHYDAVQKARERYPFAIPPPKPLSELAQTYKDAGGGKDAEAVRQELESQYGMRSLVASLWTWDPEWSRSKFPVFDTVDRAQAVYERAMKDFKKSQGAGSAANSMPPTKPRPRQKEIDMAHAMRYREIYIHSKLMIIDDSMFTLGSANLNVRSFAVDSEINIASDDAATARGLRERVWGQHTQGQFAGGVATDQKVMALTFQRWQEEANNNLWNKENGLQLTCFLVAFHDKRTSNIRLG